MGSKISYSGLGDQELEAVLRRVEQGLTVHADGNGSRPPPPVTRKRGTAVQIDSDIIDGKSKTRHIVAPTRFRPGYWNPRGQGQQPGQGSTPGVPSGSRAAGGHRPTGSAYRFRPARTGPPGGGASGAGGESGATSTRLS